MLYRTIVFLLCAGCSIHPLHDYEPSRSQGKGLCVEMIAGRYGQKLYGYLVDSIRDLRISKEHYNLKVDLVERQVPYALADDGNAQRLKVTFIAKVILKDIKGNVVLDTDVTVFSTKNISSSQGDVLLSMYNVVNDSVLRDLAFKILENVRIAVKN